MAISDSQSRALSEYILLPSYIPRDRTIDKVDLSAPLVKFGRGEKSSFILNIPFLSAAMQSVTGPRMAIALAKRGGLGVIFCSQPIESEAEMIRAVKRYKAGFVIPDVFSPEHKISDVIMRIEEKGYSTFPITDNGKPNGKLVGLLTKNDFDKERHKDLKVKERMIPIKDMVVGVDIDNLEEARKLLIDSHYGVLPIVDKNGYLQYLVFRRDVDAHIANPLELIDNKKRYKVGAAINTHDYEKRLPALVDAGVDILFIDSSHGLTDYQRDTLKFCLENFPSVPIIGGNVVTKEGFDFLVRHGAHGVKVGMGPGSICVTHEQIGVGRGQATAVSKVAEARDKYFKETGEYVPIISDGGVVIARDIIVALALGADSVMMGRFFAGCDESPTEVEHNKKPYWGEGSKKAQEWRGLRYGQTAFDEGVEGYVPYTGPVKAHVERAIAKIKDGIRKAGCSSIKELHEKAVLELVSEFSKKEGTVHDIIRFNRM